MEAVGLAASILTFIDVGCKVVKGLYEVYHSGSTEENSRVSTLSQDLEKAATTLQYDPLLLHDKELTDLCAKCQEESKKLLAILAKLQSPKSGSKFHKLKVVVAGVWKQGDVKDAEHALGQYREQIGFRLLQILCKEQSPTRGLLNSVVQNAKEMANTNGRNMEEVQNKLGETLTRLQKLQRSTEESSRSSRDSARAQEMAMLKVADVMGQLVEQLSDLQSVTKATQRGNHILRRLYFPDILRRESEVEPAEQDTFGWIVGDPRPHDSDVDRLRAYNELDSFLHSDGTVFFFCGKAGSGKSTMMKFLSNHPLVQSSLESWAGDRKLAMVQMYFWRADSRLQRTMEGFYRTILFRTLSQCPELVADIFPAKSDTKLGDLSIIAPYPVGELQEAFDRLVMLRETRDDFRFCYFIDGLDEYDGDNQSYRALGKSLVRWSILGGVKIICSARPYTVFRETFKDVGITIEFQELTRNDMRVFASRQLQTNLADPAMLSCKEACLGFVDRIVDRANGVFFWASLVVRSLINGALDGDTVGKLEQRLEECPNQVENMFGTMLSKVDSSPSVRRRSNMILYLAAHNPLASALNALALTWLDEASWFEGKDLGNFPFNLEPRSYTEPEIAVRHSEARKLLHSLTQGLLELSDLTDDGDQIPYFRYTIRFFHRSVRDFIRDHCREPFGSEVAFTEVLGRLRAAEVKFLPSAPQEEPQQLRMAPHVSSLYESTFWWLGMLSQRGLFASDTCLREFEHATTSNVPRLWLEPASHLISPTEAFWILVFRGTLLVTPSRSYRWESSSRVVGPRIGCSFLHWAIYWFQGRHFRSHLGDYHDETRELSCLLSASLASDVETTQHLLGRGLHPADLIRIVSSQDRRLDTVSVWAVFLRDFANIVNQHTRKQKAERSWPTYLDSPWLNRLSSILELHVRVGADPNAYFMVYIPQHTLGPVRQYRVGLLQLLDVFKASNLFNVEELLNDSRLDPKAGAQRNVLVDLEIGVDMTSESLPSPQLLVEEYWYVSGVVLPSWGERLIGDFEVRVF